VSLSRALWLHIVLHAEGVTRPGPWLRLEVLRDVVTSPSTGPGYTIGPDGPEGAAVSTLGGTGLSAARGGARLLFEAEVTNAAPQSCPISIFLYTASTVVESVLF
jgi:hypothetical protein